MIGRQGNKQSKCGCAGGEYAAPTCAMGKKGKCPPDEKEPKGGFMPMDKKAKTKGKGKK